MYVIVGLGNPGKKYENTRHNLGFITIDKLAEENGINVSKLKFKALVGEGRLSSERVLLVKPQTYMNLSGESVREIMNFYKLEPENLIVIYDDFDIDVGTIRIRKFGSAGTHNGMKSIIYQLQSDRFPRIRIGTGSDHMGNLIDFVTGGFTKEEVPLLESAVNNGVKACQCIISDGVDKAMNLYNSKKTEDKNG
jgi:PTH1 family peptidyl-tRNA hydrolase